MMLHAITTRARLILSALMIALATGASAAYPGEVSVKANEAKEAYEKGNFEEAARLYDEAIKLDPNDPRLKMNLGLTHFKEGKSDEALEQLSRVYDEKDEGLVARSRTGSGLVVQHQARETLEAPQKDQDQKQGPKDADDAKKKTIALLKTSLEKYREGLVMGQSALSEQNLNDTRYNYEIARRQLEELLKKQEEEKQKQSEQNQQEKKDQQQQQDQQNQQDKKDQQSKEDQQKQDKQDQQKKEQEQKDQQQQQQDQQNQQKKDEQKGEQGEPKKDEKPEGQPTPTPSPNSSPTPAPTPSPAPTPQATPPPTATPPPNKGDDATGGNPNTQSPEQPPQMSKEDVARLINGLPDNDREALQRFYGNQKQTNERMEKDW